MIEGDIVKEVHVGEALRLWCKKNNLTRQKLADLMNLPKSNIDRVLSKPSIETSKLIELSRKLNHNFFAEFWSETSYDDLEKEGVFLATPPQTINIGTIISLHLAGNHITQNQLASSLGVTHPVVSKLLKKESIDTDKLVTISNILNRNFFKEFYMLHLPKGTDFTGSPIVPVDENEAFNNILKPILKRNEDLAAENARLKDYLREVYSKMQKFKEDNGVSIENWDSLVKTEGVDVMKMATFFFVEENIKKMLDESDQADSSNKKEKDE
ncbi:helix-turn-helix domain-containing protein [Xylanibacter brevis]|uniref:helix-turn-helix domain-containing protein n=1 Tax=Xylanibacter brevis TaxID=83231 RepID=UPI0004863E02|nr:helix-turn-helix transcriptional regulator [Xylanibacter brevis]